LLKICSLCKFPGMQLATWRKSRGFTLAALAELVGVGASTMSRIERGLLRPRGEVGVKIHEVTNGEVTLNEIYGVQDQAVPPKKVAA